MFERKNDLRDQQLLALRRLQEWLKKWTSMRLKVKLKYKHTPYNNVLVNDSVNYNGALRLCYPVTS